MRTAPRNDRLQTEARFPRGSEKTSGRNVATKLPSDMIANARRRENEFLWANSNSNFGFVFCQHRADWWIAGSGVRTATSCDVSSKPGHFPGGAASRCP